MQVLPVNKQKTNFGMIRPSKGTMPQEVFDAISNSRVLKHFGKDYNADASLGHYFSPQTGKSHYLLILENIKPTSLLERVKNLITKKQINEIILKTHTSNDEEFIKYIKSQRSNSLHEIYNEKIN